MIFRLENRKTLGSMMVVPKFLFLHALSTFVVSHCWTIQIESLGYSNPNDPPPELKVPNGGSACSFQQFPRPTNLPSGAWRLMPPSVSVNRNDFAFVELFTDGLLVTGDS